MYACHKFKELPGKLFIKTPDRNMHAATFKVREPLPTFTTGNWERRFHLYLQWREKKQVRELYIGKLELKNKPPMLERELGGLGRNKKKQRGKKKEFKDKTAGFSKSP